MEDYRMGHKAPRNDGYCNPIDRLTDSFAPDVYEAPENYGSGECDEETMRQLLNLVPALDAWFEAGWVECLTCPD